MQVFLEVLQQIRRRIEVHGDRLRHNEMLTRYALIDPLLRALGWNTEDPDQVEPEFSVQEGRPDYALWYNGQPFILIEAKPFGSDLSGAREDGFRYCWKNKVSFYAVTDGNVWELYDLREMGGKEIFRVCLEEDNLGDVARRLLAMWRPAMPLVRLGPAGLIEPALQERPSPSLSLRELQAKVGFGEKPPGSLSLPDGSVHKLKFWRDLLVAVARFALPSLRQRAKIPLKVGRRGKRWLIGPSKDLRAPKALDGQLAVETHFSAKDCVRYACQILKVAGMDPEEVRVSG